MQFRLPRAVRLGASSAWHSCCRGCTGGSGRRRRRAERVGDPASGATFEGTDVWFAQLKGPASGFRSEAKTVGLKYTERFAFNKLWNGVSVRISADQLDELKGLRSVRAVYPVLRVPMPETVADPDLSTAIAMTGADITQNSLGLKGDGIKVAIMDTGIDYDHADLGETEPSGQQTVFPTGRVITGYDFVGDAYDAAGPVPRGYRNPIPTRTRLRRLQRSHGTHRGGRSSAPTGRQGRRSAA